MAPRWPALLLASAAAAAALSGLGAGQGTNPCPVQGGIETASQDHEPGASRPYELRFESADGLVDAQVTITLRDVSAGWNASVEPARLTVPPDGSATATVTVTAPASGTPREGRVGVAFDVQCAGPLPNAVRNQALGTLTPRVAGPAPTPPAPGGPGPLPWLAAVALAALAGTAALARRPRSLSLEVAEPRRDLPPGGGATFAVTLTNRSRTSRAAKLEVGELPPGWRLLAPPPEVALEPGARATVNLLVRSPPNSRPGDHAALELRVPLGPGKPAKATLQAFVVGEDARGAPSPAPERPDVVVRDEERP